MRNLYEIDDFQSIHNELYFSLNDNELKIQIEPAGQVLTDSDHLAFIYVVEEGDEFSYLQFPKKVWEGLLTIIKTKKDPFLTIDGNTIQLHNFANELEMLVFNIEGNGNYGSEFVQAVEETFREILEEE
ncbi:MAG: hypothetical protein GX072_05985 [Lysinibacillus sp.]|nr:hypothetical protein [Lysinibacillus sp.]